MSQVGTEGEHTFGLGDLNLQKGGTLHGANLVYCIYGHMNGTKDNVIVFPTYYGGTHKTVTGLVGAGKPFDTDKFCVVVPNMFGNGVSTSPSNYTKGGADFPLVTLYDNVQCQHRLIFEHLGVKRVKLVAGWSMGAMQTFQWAVLYSDKVDAFLPWCGSAKCSHHNWVFLEGVKAALMADVGFQNGHYTEQPQKGLQAFGRVYCGWAYSQTWWRTKQYQKMDCQTPQDVLQRWAEDSLSSDANDLLAMLHTWQTGDVSDNPVFKGDFDRALKSIKSKCIVMPASTDLYFPPEDSMDEAGLIGATAQLRVIESCWGHMVGSPKQLPGRSESETKTLTDAIRELLAQ
eukprot:TRINITY_DN67400_c13_g1_i1.p1 TRINITY_DN67400_c13_g1~~TRINITY_DN67400_c13_g1_i1.p1  ORF type:complete len:345 (-),score=34.00 TRINITY_DN67400_c13_g1_i1:1032-2066(-)